MRLGHVAVMVREMVFLSWDPTALHHQLALLAVRRDSGLSNTVHHMAFEVDGLAELRRVWARVKADPRATSLDPGCEGPATAFQRDQWSIRFRDPEGNGIEVYAPTPWDARAAHGRYSASERAFEEFDIDADDATLLAWAQAQLVGVEHWPRGQRPWPASVQRRESTPTRSTGGRDV